jgi:hypothetical protein
MTSLLAIALAVLSVGNGIRGCVTNVTKCDSVTEKEKEKREEALAATHAMANAVAK